MKSLELKIPPVVVLVIAALAMWAVARLFPTPLIVFPGAVWLVGSITFIGCCIVFLGVWGFGKAGTTVDPRAPDKSEKLVVSGIYRFSRNPMYLVFLLLLCSWSLKLGSALGLLFLPLFALYMNRFQIIPEERWMHNKFGESYQKYKSQVRRWI
ncbi:methyltransferase family protein [Kangiella taiwanensis]|uniref:Isoprenylcysteine carboxylmethyltransferase family protein n=1 Tax=Kangiella taiwanensis TaxID=1079179 RepID=A0ABP8I2I4_9GAMM|nr:isoprenylcysteine carboxylmethyltransferase family protein [Kangiella taiwanensis]